MYFAKETGEHIMEMNDKAEKAVAYKHKDCNCAQAVLLAIR